MKNIVAVSALLVSGVAFAQSSVTLYGIADIHLDSRKSPGVSGRMTKIDSSGIYESRFGFKGSEDLGGGLKANFQLEQGFALDTGTASTGQAFSRQSWVGVSGAYGDFRAGKTWSAFDDISGATQATKNSVFAPNAGVWLTTSYKDNPNNGLYYASPSFGGFSGVVSYGFGENKAAGVGAGSVVSMHLKYAAGPVYAGVAQQNEEATAASAPIKFTRVNGSYDLGPVKLLASYGRVSSNDKSTKEWQLGVDVPVSSALMISGGVARSSGGITGFTPDASYIGKTVNVTGAGAPDVERTGFGVMAFYSLSKRTTVYSAFQATTTKVPGAADAKGDVVALGILHLF